MNALHIAGAACAILGAGFSAFNRNWTAMFWAAGYALLALGTLR